jgi:hypothetical protein
MGQGLVHERGGLSPSGARGSHFPLIASHLSAQELRPTLGAARIQARRAFTRQQYGLYYCVRW